MFYNTAQRFLSFFIQNLTIFLCVAKNIEEKKCSFSNMGLVNFFYHYNMEFLKTCSHELKK
jgi:hypothetical protein